MKHWAWILNITMSILGLMCAVANLKICFHVKTGMVLCLYRGKT
jgi:hypothetical protein